ncbi:MAG: DUF4397 domain-containing protein [Methylocystaceae bacterium]
MNKSAVRMLHASPGTPAVDVYVNGDLAVQDLNYEEITDYLMVAPGEYNIKVFLAGETTNPAVDVDVVIPDDEITTVAAVGVLPNISVLPVVQTEKCPPPQKALARFIHLSPDAPKVDITQADNTMLFSEAEYQEVTAYLPVMAGTYDLQVRPTGLDTVMLEIPGLQLKSEHLYSIYALGRLEGQPDLKAMVVPDSTALCVREVISREPDVKPYRWDRMQIKVHYR